MADHAPTFHAASYAVLTKDGAVLLQHRAQTGWMDGHWGLPAGHIEETEGVGEALRREVKEETNIELSDSDIKLVHVMHRVSVDRVYFDFFFTAQTWKGELRNTEPLKHDELTWFPLHAPPETIIPYIKRALERIENGVFFSEDTTM